MAKPPVLKPREVVALLGKLGFAEIRRRGSHRQFRHADGRGTDIGLSVEDLLAAQPSQQPNPALQPTAEADVPKKPSKPGRG